MRELIEKALERCLEQIATADDADTAETWAKAAYDLSSILENMLKRQ